MIYGLPGSTKTFNAERLAFSVRTGTEYLEPFEEDSNLQGFKVNKTGYVWYIVADRNYTEVIERYDKMCRGANKDPKECSIGIITYHRLLNFQKEGLTVLEEAYRGAEEKPVLIILDALYGVVGDLSLSDSRVAQMLARFNNFCAETNVAWLTTHHPVVSGDKELGGSTLRGATDFMFSISLVEDDLVRIKAELIHSGPSGKEWYAEIGWDNYDFGVTDRQPKNSAISKVNPAWDWILENQEQVLGKSKREARSVVCKATGVNEKTCFDIISQLVESNYLSVEKKGQSHILRKGIKQTLTDR